MEGILIVDKPQGLTSHDVVDLVRKKFAVKKVGHAGTLDPMATGVLVLLLGRYTKLSNTYMSSDKEYEATMVLGATSDTQDAWGAIKESGKVLNFTEGQIKEVFNKFVGETEQHPPMYSAVKVNGRKLYELARKGLSVETEPKKITIKSLDISSINLPAVSFRVVCSKGTYVRQLCADIGNMLGCGAYLSALRRTRSGDFTIDKAIQLEEIKKFKSSDLQKELVRP